MNNLREQIIEIVLHSTCSANPEHWEPEYVADQILALFEHVDLSQYREQIKEVFSKASKKERERLNAMHESLR